MLIGSCRTRRVVLNHSQSLGGAQHKTIQLDTKQQQSKTKKAKQHKAYVLVAKWIALAPFEAKISQM